MTECRWGGGCSSTAALACAWRRAIGPQACEACGGVSVTLRARAGPSHGPCGTCNRRRRMRCGGMRYQRSHQPSAPRGWPPPACCRTPRRGPGRSLAFQLALGSALIAMKGYAVPEVEQTYARARVLCAQVVRRPSSSQRYGGYVSFIATAEALTVARELGEQLPSWRSTKPRPSTTWRPMKRSG